MSQKIELFIFTQAPKENSPPGFSHYLPGKWELPIPIEQPFLKIFFPEEKGGERIMELKKLPKLTKAICII